MPKREDEYWAGTKKPKGRGLCPSCGSSNIYYNKRYKSWRCGGCEKSFPSPSYGSGYDRYMTPEEPTRAAERAAERQRGTPARIYRGRDDIARGRKSRALPTLGGFTAWKAFLIFLLIACLAAAVWAGYLLFANRTDPVIGTIIFVADIGVLIWNISVLRKWGVRARTIVAIAVVIALLPATTGAFADIKPFSTARNELVTWFQKAPSQPSEQLPPLTEQQPPPVSTYPADISGRVTIADKVKCSTAIAVPPNKDSDIFWIVDVLVRNNTYDNAVVASLETGYKGWEIVANDKVYRPTCCGSPREHPPVSIDLGKTGDFMLYFDVPQDLDISDAQIRYQGQEPYSYGKLTGSDKVVAYDWDSKTVIEETIEPGDLYIVPDEEFNTSTKQLRTVAQWSGTEDEVINFSIDKSPWVINGSYEVVSSLGHKFAYLILTEEEYSDPDEAFRKYMGHEFLMPTRFTADSINWLVKQSGNFFICVYASGVEWELKVGVE
jgi:ribosomal protein L37AE/L43A